MIERVKLKFIRSYLLIIVVVVGILGVLLLVSQNMMVNDLKHKNEIMLEYVKKSIDTTLSDVSTLAYEVNENNWIIDYDAKEDISTVQAVRITQYLQLLHSVNPVVRDIAIYFPEQDVIINDRGRYQPRHYYLLYDQDLMESAQDYLLSLEENYMLNFRLESTRSGYRIFLYHSIGRQSGEHAPLLMIALNMEEVQVLMENVKLDNSEAFAILNDQGEIITGVGNQELFSTLSGTPGAAADEDSVEDDGSMVITRARSNYLGLQYVSVAKKSIFEGALGTIRILLLTGMLVAICSGILCALWLGRKNIKPLNSLSEVIRITDAPAEEDEEGQQDFTRM